MRKILLLNAIVEIAGGMIIILNPSLLFYNTPLDDLSFNISKMYGILAAAFGFISYLLYQHAESAKLVRYSCLVILGFHLILSFHLYGIYRIALIHHIAPAGFHLAIFIVTGIWYLRSVN